jgi:signal transduction histidine kinase
VSSRPPLILLVDDQPGSRYTIRKILQKAQYEVKEAATGADALRLAAERPDLVILDVGLPDLSGYEVCQKIKAEPATASIPVLHLSASFAEVENRVRGLEGGADGYLTYPVEPPELLANVQALLRVREAERALQDEGRRKDEFLAMLAHELRNPLAPIRNAIQIIRLAGSQNPAVVQAGEMVERQVQHMTRLVDDLLDVSRVSRGKIELRKEKVALATIIARATENTRPAIDAGNHELILNLPPRPIHLEGDPTRLVQILGNLLTNAAKYTDSGGRIWLTAEREGDQAILRVRDTGIGIRADLLPHVFDLFVQSDRALDRAAGGLGIGLTLVRSLVEMHGGTVVATSEGQGRGSEFIVHLPILPETEAIAGAEELGGSERRIPPVSRRRILIVDDNVDSAVSLAMLLQLQRHEVNVAHDGRAAIEAVRRHQPEIVFLDIGLPALDGYEVARRLRQEHGQDCPVLVALTGYGQVDDRRRSDQAGFNAHMVKPIDLDALQLFLANGEAVQEPGNA